MPSIPTEKLAEAAANDIVDAFSQILAPLGVAIESVTREVAFVTVVAKTTASFIVATWDPRDRFSYWIGPLADAQVPPRKLWYDLAGFMAYDPALLESRPDLRYHRVSPLAGARAIEAFASAPLRGDWSQRPILD